MTLPVFRPLMISATFVLCSAFAGNCRAEADLPCAVTLQNRAIMLDGETCISKKRLPGCPVLCQPSEVLEKKLSFPVSVRESLYLSAELQMLLSRWPVK